MAYPASHRERPIRAKQEIMGTTVSKNNVQNTSPRQKKVRMTTRHFSR